MVVEEKNFNFLWLGVTALCLAVLSFLFPQVFKGTMPHVRAAAYTICASGCNYTSITAANAAATTGDTLTLSASYSTAGETFPLSITAGVTVNCQEVATIGSTSLVTITLNNTTTIKNCILKNVNATAAGNASGITLDNNNRFAGSTSSFAFEGSMNNIMITSNTLTYLIVGATDKTAVSTTVSGNSFTIATKDSAALTLSGTPSNVTITSNTFSFGPSAITDDSNYTAITLAGNNIVFATNTLSFTTQPLRIGGIVMVQHAQNVTLNGNYIVAPEGNTSEASGFYLSASTTIGKVNMINNTVKCPKTSSCAGVYITDGGVATASMSVTSTYNIFYSTSTANFGFDIQKDAAGSTMNLFNDYNGFYTLTAFRNNTDNSTFSASSTSRTDDPYFRTSDTDGTNDSLLVPFSLFFDVNGTLDIGANTGVRRATMTVNPTGTIDYSSVDATSTLEAAAALKTGDTMSISAGTHVPFIVSSTYATSSITIDGAGATSIVQGTTYGILFISVSSSSVTDLVVQNASSTVSTYTATKMVFTAGGNSYGGNLGLGANVTHLVSAASCGVTTAITADGQDITSLVNSTTGDWHLVLAKFGATRGTLLVPNSLYTSISSPSLLSDCAGSGMTTIDKWVTSTFSRSSGVFTYDSTAVSNAGVTLSSGLSLSTPAVTRTLSTPYGIKLANSNAITFENVTSTANTNGIWFSGTSANNIVSSSVFSSSGSYDIKSDTSATNSFKNTTFVASSSTISGAGAVKAYFKARALVQSGGTAVAGASVTLTSADSTVTASLTSGSDGYTPYSDHLLSFTLNSSANAETSGGYNPFAAAVAATSTYGAGTSSQNLNTQNQTITFSVSNSASNSTAAAVASGGWFSSALTTLITNSVSTPTIVDSSKVVSPIVIVPVVVPVKAPLPITPVVIDSPAVSPASTAVNTKPISPVFVKLLSVGSQSAEVRELQNVLLKLGLLKSDSVTGFFGAKTQAAVIAFQKKNKIDAVGFVGVSTRAALNKLSAPSVVPAPTVKGVKIVAEPPKKIIFVSYLAIGSESNEVKMLQEKLKSLGFLTATPNGYFGAATEKAVKKFQEAHGIKPAPGYIGPSTRALLNN